MREIKTSLTIFAILLMVNKMPIVQPCEPAIIEVSNELKAKPNRKYRRLFKRLIG